LLEGGKPVEQLLLVGFGFEQGGAEGVDLLGLEGGLGLQLGYLVVMGFGEGLQLESVLGF
jgi:hypothetical protein